MIHVFLGTKAQYIKTAPVIHELDRRGVDYRLIDSGQHGRLTSLLRSELGIRDPDVSLGDGRDIETVPHAIAWSARIAAQLVSRSRLQRDVFGDQRGTCLLHGDTPTTLLSAAMAHRAGLEVAHLEAGLRSHSLVHPFPEEIIRLLVMRRADVLFAPDAHAADNLAAMRVRGRVIRVSANTIVESLHDALDGDFAPTSKGAVIVTVHRVENLHRPRAMRELLRVMPHILKENDVEFVTHGPTQQVLAKRGSDALLTSAGVRLVPLLAHATFVERLRDAPFVITDGGSIQEECALLGVPTLLWRARTEREDGLGENVVLSNYDPALIDQFIAEPQRWRRPPVDARARPSKEIVDALLSA